MLEDEISRNRWKSYFIFFIIPVIIVLLFFTASQIFFPEFVFGALIAGIIFSLLYTLITYYKSADIVLSVVKARPADPKEHKFIINTIEGLAIAAGLPVPKIYVQDTSDINAFATGRDPDHGVICVTTGAMQKLTRQELEGVLAHEMAHIKNYDIRFMTIVVVMVGLISIFAEVLLRGMFFGGRDDRRHPAFIIIGLLLAILAPIIARLVQLAISRQREYLADSSGAHLSRNPEGLASALEKIKAHNEGRLNVPKATEPLYFANPFKADAVKHVFSTHPPIDERIRRLRGR